MVDHAALFQRGVGRRFGHGGRFRFADDGDVQFGGFSPEDYSRNRSPYAFDGAAECPRFLNELIYPAVSAEDADLKAQAELEQATAAAIRAEQERAEVEFSAARSAVVCATLSRM